MQTSIGFLTSGVGLGIAGLFVLTVLFSVLLGAVVGAVYCLCKIPSVVVALVVAMFFEVIGFKITDGAAFLQVDSELCVLGRTPWNLIVAALSLVAFALMALVVGVATFRFLNARGLRPGRPVQQEEVAADRR